jgi:hypothetical protein
VGAKSEGEVSIAAMKQAWRDGGWCRDPYWIPIFLMAGGGAMMLYGGFGAAIVAGPLYVKLICGGALAYATFQLIAAIRRA